MLSMEQPVGHIMPSAPQNAIIAACLILIAIALIYAIILAARQRDNKLLVILFASAAGISLEAFACYLIKCYYPEVNNIEAYTAFGIHVPLYLALMYLIVFGLFAFFFEARFSQSPSPALFWGGFAFVSISEGLFEIYATHVGLLSYWGAQGVMIGGFPAHLGFVNPSLALGFTAYMALGLRLLNGGARWLLVPLAVPFMVGFYAAMVMPAAAGLYTQDVGLAMFGQAVTVVLALALSTISLRVLAYCSAPRSRAGAESPAF